MSATAGIGSSGPIDNATPMGDCHSPDRMRVTHERQVREGWATENNDDELERELTKAPQVPPDRE